jgi:hypothetical protein
VRLLERQDLENVLKAAGLDSTSLGDVFLQRKEAVYLASPYEKWSNDDAVALTDNVEEWGGFLAGRLVAEEPSCAGSQTQPAPTAACTDKAIDRISRRLFRRPPTAEMANIYKRAVAQEAAAVGNGFDALSFAFSLALQSPSFLYRPEIGIPSPREPGVFVLDPWETAQSLALGMTGLPPDSELQRLAQSGELLSQDVLRTQGRRLLATPEGKARLWRFYEKWLGLIPPESIRKDAAKVPNFSAARARSAHEDTRTFVLEALFAPQPGGLTQILGGARGDRAGALTMHSFLLSQSGVDETRPLHMADVLFKNVACVSIPPPPAAALQVAYVHDPTKSRRQNFEARTSGPQCASCHVSLNGVAFSFDRFDPAGERRETLMGFPLDTTGSTRLSSGAVLAFSGPEDLMAQLSATDDVKACHTAWMHRFVRGYSAGNDETCGLKPAYQALKSTSNPIDAYVELHASPGLLRRKGTSP